MLSLKIEQTATITGNSNNNNGNSNNGNGNDNNNVGGDPKIIAFIFVNIIFLHLFYTDERSLDNRRKVQDMCCFAKYKFGGAS